MTRPHDRIAHELERLKAERARQDAELPRLTEDLDIDESEVAEARTRFERVMARVEARRKAPKPNTIPFHALRA